jgi:DNA replication protein DnaC
VPEHVDYRAPRGLERRLFDRRLKGDWIASHENLAIVGPTGIGKSWLVDAMTVRSLDATRDLAPRS